MRELPLLSAYFVIVVPRSAVSTPIAFSELDEIYGDFSSKEPRNFINEYTALYNALIGGAVDAPRLFNLFESCPSSFTTKTKEAKKMLLDAGALTAVMSGSGAACFGIFRTKSEAESANRYISSLGFSTYYAESVFM